MLKPISLDIDAVPASPLPIALADVKAQVSVDFTDDDTLLTNYLLAAILAAEGRMHRTIVSRAHRWTLWDFPQTPRQNIRLPRGKTQSVASIKHTTGGTVTTLTGPSSSPTGDDYQEALGGDDGGTIMPSRGESWPSVDFDVPAPVLITFTAGWASADIPDEIVQAIMLLIGGWYQSREHVVLGGSIAELPFGVEPLLSGYALSRWY